MATLTAYPTLRRTQALFSFFPTFFSGNWRLTSPGESSSVGTILSF
jgi:hypothetical protein